MCVVISIPFACFGLGSYGLILNLGEIIYAMNGLLCIFLRPTFFTVAISSNNKLCTVIILIGAKPVVECL